MLRRSDLRNACYRAKKNVAGEEHKKMLEMILPLLTGRQTIMNFPNEWDIMVKGDEIKIVRPETDYDYIHSTLLEVSLYAKQGVDFDSFDDRQQNIIITVETLMLDGIMNWKNYNKVWGVTLDPIIKQIQTVLYNVKSSQIEVTDDMIKASMKDADGNPLTEEQIKETKLEMKPMDASMQKAFEEFMAKKNK